jgi:hypothetical protein
MDHLIAQRDLEAVATSLLPLVPFMSGKSCEEGTSALVKLLREGLEAQEAASKRADELKNLTPKTLMELFALESKAPAASSKEALLNANSSASSNKMTSRNKKMKAELEVAEQQSQSRGTRKRPKKGEEKEAEMQEQGKLKKQKSKQGKESPTIRWNGVDYPRITRLFKCEGKEDANFRVQVYAKGQNETRGLSPETIFSLNAAQLREIDNLHEDAKSMVKDSFLKAATRWYRQKWPNVLRVVLSGTVWGSDILPPVA